MKQCRMSWCAGRCMGLNGVVSPIYSVMFALLNWMNGERPWVEICMDLSCSRAPLVLEQQNGKATTECKAKEEIISWEKRLKMRNWCRRRFVWADCDTNHIFCCTAECLKCITLLIRWLGFFFYFLFNIGKMKQKQNPRNWLKYYVSLFYAVLLAGNLFFPHSFVRFSLSVPLQILDASRIKCT